MEILFVGASSAAVRAGEETACYLINGKILIDTGWNAAVTMQEFGAQAADIDHVLFTHCHQDHTLGLPGVFFANRQRASDAPLRLYGPMDLPVVCAGAKALLQADRYPQAVPAHEVQLVYPGDELEIAGLGVQVGRAFHPLDARSYRFTDPDTGASVVFSGDTFYHQGLPLFAAGCDVLVHEAAARPDASIEALQRYLHSRPQDAAQVAVEAGASELVLVHYPGDGGAAALERARAIFPAVRLGEKGMRVHLQGAGKVSWN